MSDRGDLTGRRPWLRAWLVVGLAAWATIGVVLVDRANRLGLVDNIAFSPYHLVGYAALLTLAAYVGWSTLRALRRGSWRRALPPLYGGLGLGLVAILGWVVVDIVWRSTLGINPGIEGGLAPSSLLIPVGLVLLAVGPVREAIAQRTAPGLAPGELRVRWAGVVATGLVGAALTLVAFSPVREPLNDLALNAPADRSEIWTMAADGSRQTRLLPAAGDGVDFSLPAWSPDGSRIAYTVWTNPAGVTQNLRNTDQTAAIWTMAADGSDRRLLVAGAPDQAWIAAWSPDGRWLAYTISPSRPSAAPAAPAAGGAPGKVGPAVTRGGSSIWVQAADGQQASARRLTPENVDAILGAWSPDGQRLAYVAGAGLHAEIHVGRFTETGLTEDVVIGGDPGNDWGPAWSPDGANVAFVSNRSGNDELWLAPADGSGTPRQLTDDGAGDWVPAFSPDGSRIAFVSDRTGEPEIWTMAVDGSDPRNLSNNPGQFDGQWSLAWSPDGSRIAYAGGSYPGPAASSWVREDFAAAQWIVLSLALAVVALIAMALGAPLGSFAVVTTVIVGLNALATDEWRFLPGALLAGLLVDLLVRAVRLRHRARVAAAALPALTALAVNGTLALGGTLAWSVTLLLGVAMAAAVLGWGLAEAAERLFPRPATQPAELAREG